MARKASAALTDGEARVMAVLWGLNSATVAQVVTQLQAQYQLTYSTVQTTLRILEQKGYVAHEKVALLSPQSTAITLASPSVSAADALRAIVSTLNDLRRGDCISVRGTSQ